jgi:glycosyltransferase involved in cell wall biosynthesis
VHSATPKAGLLLISAAFLARVPIRTHSFTGQIWANKNGIYRRFLQLIDRLIVRLSTHILADSFSQRSYLEAQGIVRSGVIAVLGKGSMGGVDLVRFCPNRNTRQSKRLAIGTSVSTIVYLFVGRVTREKGIFDLLSAFHRVASAITGVELWIVGPKEEVFETNLKGFADEAASGVRWLGSTDKPEEYMAAADVLVLPSYREGFGTVIIEASACQLPIIAYKTEGVVDAVLDGNSGVLVSKYDVELLSQEMIRLASNDELRYQMGLNGLEFVRHNYSSDLIAAEWVQFYKRIFDDISMVRN